MHGIFLFCGFTAVAFVLFLTGYLLVAGLPAIRKIGLIPFLTGIVWNSTGSDPQYGIVLGVPVGVLTAIYLAKMAPEGVRKVLRTAVDLLAGIPSVVYGLVGMMVLVPTVQKIFNLPHGANLFSAILVLAVMILPTVISVSETALRAVPKEYEEASLALGATKTETVMKVSVHAASSGIASAVVMGIGRAIGEAMAVMMVSGNVANMPGLFTSVRFLTTGIVSEMSYAADLHRQSLFSIGLVLFVFIFFINLLLNRILKKGAKAR